MTLYPNPNPKAVAAKKFIEFYYPNVDRVKITYYTLDVPSVDVYFYQDNVRFANADSVFREEIIRDLKNYIGIKGVSSYLLSWEQKLDINKHPDIYVTVHSLNYDITA